MYYYFVISSQGDAEGLRPISQGRGHIEHRDRRKAEAVGLTIGPRQDRSEAFAASRRLIN